MASQFGEMVQAAVQARAERLVAAGLKRLGWTEEDLRARRKGEPWKVAFAHELPCRTTMPLAWIAPRRRRGSRGYLTWLLQRRSKGSKRFGNTIN